MGPPAAVKYCVALAKQIDQSGSHLSGLPNNILPGTVTSGGNKKPPTFAEGQGLLIKTKP